MTNKSKKDIQREYFDTSCIEKNTEFSFEYTNLFIKSVYKYFKTKEEKFFLCEVLRKMSIFGDLIDINFKAHNLKGKYKGYREAHLKDDLLIVWKKEENNIILTIIGTHNELFC